MANAKNVDLGDIDGIPVAGTTIAIRNAGDGLSKAMKVDPKLIHHRETVFVVLECECVDVQFPEIKDANEVMRKHVLRAGVATIVDRAVVIAAVDAQRDRIQAARDAQTGAQALDFGGDPDPDADPLGVGNRASDEDQPPPGARKTRARKPAAKKPVGTKPPAKKRAAAKPKPPAAKPDLASVPTGPDATGPDAT